MSSQSQTWTAYRGEDVTIVLTGEDTTNPTGWGLLFTLSVYSGQTPVTLSSTSITVGTSGSYYTLSVTLSRTTTSALTGSKYAVDWWRTDTGSNVRIAGGVLNVETPVRLPA